MILPDIFNLCSKQNWDSKSPKLLLGQALKAPMSRQNLGTPDWIAPRLALPKSLFNSVKARLASGSIGNWDANNKSLVFCEKFGI